MTPFAMPEYRVEAREDAGRLDAEAEALSATARTNVQRATNYGLAVALLGAVVITSASEEEAEEEAATGSLAPA